MKRCIRVAITGVVAAWLAIASSLSPSPASAADTNYQGLWWNDPPASESGWGINFAHQGDVIFATWFTYDAAGNPWWLIAELHKTAPGVYAGGISTVSGPPFNAVPFSPGNVVETEVGTATVTFADGFNATFEYTVNVAGAAKAAVTQSKTITRQLFASPAPICVWGDPQAAATANNYQDLWWAAPPGSEAGWGINFTHQGDIIFATWFTYDAAGKPWWLIALLQKTSPGVYTGDISTVTGPPFNSVPFPPSALETVVGTSTVTFADLSNATFSYTVNGIAQTKAITRQVFAAPGTTCHTPEAAVTAVGTPNGAAATGTIGAAGGSLASIDGKITLTIPPNALAGNVQFTIQPLTNEAPGGLGSAYQLLPDGQVFALPAQIVFHYDDEDLAGTFAEALSLGFQDGQGFWHALKSVNLDKVNKTLAGSTTHLSIWSSLAGVQLFPGSARVPVGTSKPLTLIVCLGIDSGDPSSTLQARCEPEGNVRASGWAVNGVPGGNPAFGFVLSGSDFGATYRAPFSKPTPDVVAVSAQIVGLPGGKKYQVVSNLKIEEATWSGSTKVVTSEFNTTAEIGWRLLSAANGVFTYVSSGTATYNDARCSVSPSSVPIEFSNGILRVDFNTNPPTWQGAGVREWEAHFTCPPPEDPYDFVVAVGFLGEPGGVVTVGGAFADVIEGTVMTDNYSITWYFIRNTD